MIILQCLWISFWTWFIIVKKWNRYRNLELIYLYIDPSNPLEELKIFNIYLIWVFLIQFAFQSRKPDTNPAGWFQLVDYIAQWNFTGFLKLFILSWIFTSLEYALLDTFLKNWYLSCSCLSINSCIKDGGL